jgi:distribution and morphology protein 12
MRDVTLFSFFSFFFNVVLLLMSFAINWDLLADGEIAERLRTWLNDRFDEIDRPSFLGPLKVTELDFGDVPPNIEIKDVCDPIPEFYLPDDFDVYSSPQAAANLASLIALTTNQGSIVPQETESNHQKKSETSGSLLYGDKLEEPVPEIQQPTASYSSPSLQTTTVPLGSGVSVDNLVEEFVRRNAEYMKRPSDAQVEILVEYRGNLRIAVTTELIVNQPTPAFITLPLTLTLAGFSFSGMINGL